MYDNIKDKDINEVFDDILLFEENVIEEAYEEGFNIGVQQGNKEGYHLGFHRGSEIGAEIGFYLGVVEKYLELYSKSTDEKFSKPKSSLENLKIILSEFPQRNSAEIDVFEALDTIRAQFKKVCAQMRVNISYPGKSNMSF